MKVALFNTHLGRLLLTGMVLTFGMSTAASAAGTARVSTMSASGKRVIANVDFTGAGNFRASAVLAGRPTLIMRDGRAYALAGGGEQPLSSATQAEASGVTRPNTGDEEIVNLVSLKATGRKEARAGFSCDIYDVTFFDRSGRRRIEQIAVSSDPRARELTDLWRSVNDALLGVPEAGDLQKQLQANGLGLLRFSYRYQVDKLDVAVRLPPVQAYAPLAPRPVEALVGAQTMPPMTAPAAPLLDDSLWSRIRHFTQGSVVGTLIGR